MSLPTEWFKGVFGKNWLWVLPLVALISYTYYEYKAEQSYHKWAGSFIAHQYSDVKYENGYVQIRWEKLPKAPKTDIIIHYLRYRPGLPLIGTAQQFIPIDESNVYRDGRMQDEHNMHLVPYWGSPVFVGNLEPGRHELVVYYEYPNSWWHPDWTADQRIVFIVE